MRMLVPFVFVASVAAGSVAAQTDGQLCHHAGLTYSPGSMITMGQSLQRCATTQDGTVVWSAIIAENDEETSANCVSGGREFGHGSVLNAQSEDRICSNGVWFSRK